ncbi:sigma-70 family RNA polymerase sigma factor [Caballeronia sp. BR00000012568055]|uniref:sigma-70 family RNA polymerase sigma factor n=1 Tax=Caballeronia sp. BR00000012568055 TaxID=2918761 RepID=UPI0023F7F0E0|nr:sigma-70 family RNA polymerase sigma factor [Caballeronia sp. BR00000012568055]
MTEPRIPKNDRRAPVTFDFFHAQRRRLVSLAYRMLGSRAEAEDVVQDAWLKWHTADSAELREPGAWLTTVVTRLSIDRLRVLQTEYAARESGWLPEPWIDSTVPSPENEVLDGAQLSYGLTLLMDKLSPDERAAFLLREAFDCDYAAISEAIGRQAEHCRQLIHRAKTRLARAGAPQKPVDAVARRRVVGQLRDAIAAQDHAALFEALNGTQMVCDTPEPVYAVAHAEVPQLEEPMGDALFVDGDVVALWVPGFNADGEFVMHIVTEPEAVAEVNRTVGRDAITQLLARISQEAKLSLLV